MMHARFHESATLKDRSCGFGSLACHQLYLTVLAKLYHPVLTQGEML